MVNLTEIIKVWPKCEECVYASRDVVLCERRKYPQQEIDIDREDCCGEGLFLVEIDDNYKEWMGGWKREDKKDRPYALVNYEDYLNVKNLNVG